MAHVLVVDDERSVRFTLTEVLEDRGHKVTACRRGRDALQRAPDVDVVLTDLRMPEMSGLALLEALRATEPTLPVILLTARGSEADAVAAMKLGAHDYLTKPFDNDELTLAIERAIEVSQLRRGQRQAQAERRVGVPIIGEAPALRAVLDSALRVASRDLPVLVTGETGTGKELLASLLHAASARKGAPLVRFNCAALPHDLAEAELFGHARGAFTGATTARQGYFRQAHGGTLVLDEIGEMPMALQAKLLRAVQSGEIQPLGTAEPEMVDVRIVACTAKDLKDAIKRDRFREDLYYRLAVVELEMPPLRDRRQDIPRLARAFASRYAQRFQLEGVRLEPGLIAALRNREWPGNVRELENTIARLLALSEGGVLGVDALQHPEGRPLSEGLRAQVDAYEKQLLQETLTRCGGNQSEAARVLQISRSTLVDKIRRYGLRN
ncbi:MAG: sigma-54 dependent transcriptional regulator [Myxococcota bacterium]